MSRELAPIALTVYTRADHTLRTIEALKQNDLAAESDLFIYADGARNESDQPAVAEVREAIKNIEGFKSVTIVDHTDNWGLAKSVITAATELTDKYGKVIMLEDDIVTAPGFLTYMNDALDVYQDVEQVMHISGYMFPVKADLPETVFYNTASTWGWATWKRAWKHFNNDISQLKQQIDETGELSKFNIEGTYNFYKQIEDNYSGRVTTWGIRWYATMFLMGGLALHPGKSLVQNIGNDASGTNSGNEGVFWHEQLADSVKVDKLPLVESEVAREAMREFYRAKSAANNMSFQARAIRKLKRIIKKTLNVK
jgi:hypothetical protein